MYDDRSTYFSIFYEVNFLAVIYHSILSADINSAVAAQLAVSFVREHSAVEIGALYFGIFLTALFYESSYGSIQNLKCAPTSKKESAEYENKSYLSKSSIKEYGYPPDTPQA